MGVYGEAAAAPVVGVRGVKALCTFSTQHVAEAGIGTKGLRLCTTRVLPATLRDTNMALLDASPAELALG